MTSEVGDDGAVRQRRVGPLSEETDATQRQPDDSLDDLSSAAAGTDTASTVSGLTPSDAAGVTGNRPTKKFCRAMENEEPEEKRSRSVGDDDDLASREILPRDCTTARQQQSLPVGRSQYHSIQQLSRPSNVNHHLFDAFQLDDAAELYRHRGSQAMGSAGVPAGPYTTEMGRPNSESQRRAMDYETRQDDVGAARVNIEDDEEKIELVFTTEPERRAVSEQLGYVTKTLSQKLTSTTAENPGRVRQNGVGSAAVEELKAKRARVEHIVRSMRTPPGDVEQSSSTIVVAHQQRQQLLDGRRQRRKQFAPLQHQHEGYRTPRLERSDDDDSDRDDSWTSQTDVSESKSLHVGLQRVQDRLVDMQRKYMRYLDDSSKCDVIGDVRAADEPATKRDDDDADDSVIASDFNRNEILCDGDHTAPVGDGRGSGSFEALASMLKAEINGSVSSMVDDIVNSFIARRRKVAGGGGGEWRMHSDGRTSPIQRSTTPPIDTSHLSTLHQTDTDAASSAGIVPPPLTPIRTSTAVDLRFPVPPPTIPAGNVQAMQQAAAAAAKLVVDRYSAMAAYLDNAYLLHGKTAFEMPPSHASSVSPASAAHRLFTPTPYYPAQHAVSFQSHVLKVIVSHSRYACEV